MKINNEYDALKRSLRKQGMTADKLREMELVSASLLEDCGFSSAEDVRRVAMANGKFASKRRSAR